MDMNTHLLQWKAFLESVLGRQLTPEDYLLPHIGVNGVIHTTRQMSYDSLQTMLSTFCKKSGTKKRYTTHSFRRGGAQYRFMYAPVGQRWSLNRIRWWGGWAVGEHVRLWLDLMRLANFSIQCDTLIKYLVDSLQSFESGHGDALHPIPIDPINFFMGDHTAMAPATTEEVHQLSASISWNIQTLTTKIESVLSKTTNWQDISQLMIGEVQKNSGRYQYSRLGLWLGAPWIEPTNQLDLPAFQVENSQEILISPSHSWCFHSFLELHTWGMAPSSEAVDWGGSAHRVCLERLACKMMKDKTASLQSQWQVIFKEYER